MKKTIIILFLSMILLSGCNDKEEVYKNLLKEHSKVYYEKYMIGVGNQTQAEITIEMLKNANKYDGKFDLSGLSKCDDSTNVVLNLNKEKQIIDYNFNLKCK